jgi:hypothetical protein
MNVAFRRTGARRYAVVVSLEGEPARVIEPAPGYDDDIPHDLVHYLVEAELGLTYGVYGSAARGGGTFTATLGGDIATRERRREQRKQQKRERALRAHDAGHGAEMERSERIAGVCDLVWRRQHGQRPDPGRPSPVLRAEDAADVERVVTRLDAIAPMWRQLPVGGELVFEWPAVTPLRRQAGA